MKDVQQLSAQFAQRFGREPDGVWAGPGRVNLIGEHTDYNDGYVMPFALEQVALVAVGLRDDEDVNVVSSEFGSEHTASITSLQPFDAPGAADRGWYDYLTGVVWALYRAGRRVGGIDVLLASDVPMGAGLSSSAAIECAMVTALCDLFDLEIEPIDRAKLARVAENAYVGAPTGLLDQAASTLCRKDHALFLDCRTDEHRHIRLPLHGDDLELLVLDTKTPHHHVDGEYAERRRSCEEAARLLGVPALRDVSDLGDALADLDRAGASDLLKRRMRHVVTENTRVLTAVATAESGRLRDLGELLNESHASMRDDFEITVPTVDLAVEAARAAGALGARMTGGGFGGCIIALCQQGHADEVGQQVALAFSEAGYDAPEWFTALPRAGARRVD